ncbi:MAG: radical SAM protein, partial [Clostridia bacterium]|nr:radical SAM protein [Clostridia bacterium]
MNSSLKGKVHSFQSLGAVDGPGIRFVVFMQGCPYRCPYCHNPDTRPFSGGEEYTVEEIVKKAVRFKSYFGEKGGVTVSGGEPLAQAEFVAELFEQLHKVGINTALDTAGYPVNEAVKKVLRHTDTVLCDIKFPTDEQYKNHIGTSLEATLSFIDECNNYNTDIIIRHVVVPGMTDSE